MAVLRLALVLFVLTLLQLALLQTDAIRLSFSDVPENGAAAFRTSFTDTIAALVNDVDRWIGSRVRARSPRGGEAYAARPVLEPGTMFLMGFGLLGISIWARRRWTRRREGITA